MAPRGDPLKADLRRQVQKHDEVGFKAAGREGDRGGDAVGTDTTARALIGPGRWRVAVRHDHAALREPGPHHMAHELGTSGGDEQQLSLRCYRIAPIDDESSEDPPERSASRLSRQ